MKDFVRVELGDDASCCFGERRRRGFAEYPVRDRGLRGISRMQVCLGEF